MEKQKTGQNNRSNKMDEAQIHKQRQMEEDGDLKAELANGDLQTEFAKDMGLNERKPNFESKNLRNNNDSNEIKNDMNKDNNKINN